MITIYSISCPFTMSVKYVGQTGDLELRKIGHLHSKSSTKISLWICELKKQGVSPIFNVLEVCEKSNGILQERFWYDFMISSGYSLLNTTIPMGSYLKSLKNQRKSGSRIKENILIQIRSDRKLMRQLTVLFGSCENTIDRYIAINSVRLTALSCVIHLMSYFKLEMKDILTDDNLSPMMHQQIRLSTISKLMSK